MLFSRAKICEISTKIWDIFKEKPMKIEDPENRFSLIFLWKCLGFWRKIHTFLLLKITYLLDK